MTWSKPQQYRRGKKSCKSNVLFKEPTWIDMVLHILQNTLLLRFIGQLFSWGHSAPNPPPLLLPWNNDIVMGWSVFCSLRDVIILHYYISHCNKTFSTLANTWHFSKIYGPWNPVLQIASRHFNLLFVVQPPCLVCIGQVGHGKLTKWSVNYQRSIHNNQVPTCIEAVVFVRSTFLCNVIYFWFPFFLFLSTNLSYFENPGI